MVIVIQFNLLIKTYPIRPSTNQEPFLSLLWLYKYLSWVLLLLTTQILVSLLPEIVLVHEVSPGFLPVKMSHGMGFWRGVCQDQP